MVPGPAPSASPEQLFEMQVFGPHPRPVYLQMGCGNLYIKQAPSGDSKYSKV